MVKKKETDVSTFTVRIPNDLNDFLNDYADKLGVSKNTLIILSLHEYRKENSK